MVRDGQKRPHRRQLGDRMNDRIHATLIGRCLLGARRLRRSGVTRAPLAGNGGTGDPNSGRRNTRRTARATEGLDPERPDGERLGRNLKQVQADKIQQGVLHASKPHQHLGLDEIGSLHDEDMDIVFRLLAAYTCPASGHSYERAWCA